MTKVRAIGSSATPAETLGERLRRARLGSGLTLSELSRRTGVGKGSISELENDRRKPRLETLWNLTTAIGVPLGAVMGDAEEPSVDGASVAATLLGGWFSGGLREAYRATIAPVRQVSDPHSPGVIETLTVLAGAVRVGTRDAPQTLQTGQSCTFAGDVPHMYEGMDGTAEVMIVIQYPPSFGSQSV